MLKYRKKTS